MIVTLDLSHPRKLAFNAINNIIFELKMRNINISKYGSSLFFVMLYLALKKDTTFAADANFTKRNMDVEALWNAVHIYGIPTIHTLFEGFKSGSPLKANFNAYLSQAKNQRIS